jgi:spermidine synthase
MNALGRHILVEFYDCPTETLNDVAHIEKSMLDAATLAEATVISSTFHHFSPFGVSGVVVIQESHLTVHTWPEYGYASMDIFTCGDAVNPWVAYKFLQTEFGAQHGSAMEMQRGVLDLLEKQTIDVSKLRDTASKKIETIRQERNVWFTERNEAVALSLKHSGDRLYKKQSPFQKVEIYDTMAYGKMLTLDGMVMCTEGDEYAYHEMISHVAMLTHPQPKRALIIGGGDGGAARELLRHDGLEEVVMVEIDELVIEASRQFLPTISTVFGHPRLKLLIDDGIKYVADCPDNSFDFVIVDSTDPVGPAEGLFSAEFYRNVHRILRTDGILVVQSESPRFNAKVFREIHGCFRDIFGVDQVFCYLIFVPTYPTGMWSLAYCSKGRAHPLKNLDEARAAAFTAQHDLQYYNPAVHRAAFALPNFVSKILR